MGKKIKIAILLLGVYLAVFWIGFKSGCIYLRMQEKIRIERVEKIEVPANTRYYIVKKYDYGSYSNETIKEVDSNHLLIRIFMNEKLRPLLTSLNIKIYKDTGERIY